MELHPPYYNNSRGSSSRQLRQIRTATSMPSDSEEPYRTYTAPPHIHDRDAEKWEEPAVKPTHQRFLFTDQVALRYLEEDSSTTVLDRRRRLEGYQLYIVEQWACSRVHPTFVITTYTGDPSHSVVVSVLSVPADERSWSDRLRVYFKAVSQFYARRKETPLGTLMVTNLSGFPSALTVIPVPEGDGRKHREDFFVNENLKRLGCSGRAGLTLSPPTDATQAKFHQLYRTSDRIPLYQAVLEMVKLCQGALTIFNKLGPEYVDGLLCDITEGAINDWWTEIGTEFYNIEPSDGILGPTTVAALLGMLMGARNRLNAYGAPVAKDAFDLESLKRGIAYFQKAQKLSNATHRRLDRQTIDKLHRATAKAASGDGWLVPKAVKSTMAELSGKGGEMMMEMVGAREKAGIADIETLDIETFVQLIHGERAKWLWYGKPRKGVTNESFGRTSEDRMVFGKDEQGGYIWSSRKRYNTLDEPSIRRAEEDDDPEMKRPLDSQGSFENLDKDQYRRKAMFRGRMSDARSGFGRFKDAISRSGPRGHQRGTKVDGLSQRLNDSPLSSAPEQQSDLSLSPTKSYSNNSQKEFRKLDDGSIIQTPVAAKHKTSKDRGFEDSISTPISKLNNSDLSDSQNHLALSEGSGRPTSSNAAKVIPMNMDSVQSSGANLSEPINVPSDPSRAPSIHDGEPDASTSKLPAETTSGTASLLLRRTQSASSLVPYRDPTSTSLVENENRYPRHLSFSMVEDAVLPWEDVCAPTTSADTIDPSQAYKHESYLATTAARTAKQISTLESQIAPWVESRLQVIEDLDAYGATKQEELHALYVQRLEEYHALQSGSEELIAAEKSHIEDAIKEVETLGAKLEYELSSLVSKVEDVEDSVSEFEKQVILVEARARQLEDEGKPSIEGWGPWFCRVLLGHGDGR